MRAKQNSMWGCREDSSGSWWDIISKFDKYGDENTNPIKSEKLWAISYLLTFQNRASHI
jgi:hypothetical protein